MGGRPTFRQSKRAISEIEQQSTSTDVALLAQQMGFLVIRFDEFKTNVMTEFKVIKDNASSSYVLKATADDHEKRLSRVEKALLGVLTFVFMAFLSAVVGLVITKK